jgi:hypothetical protein
MKEHEQLNKICEVVWYKWGKDLDILYCTTSNTFYKWAEQLDVREIIFTKEFWGKLCDYFWCDIWDWLEDHLDYPVNYIYSLMK